MQDNQVPLHCVCISGRIQNINALMRAAPEAALIDDAHGMRPWMFAVFAGQTAVLRHFLENYSGTVDRSPDVTNGYTATMPLLAIMDAGNVEMLDLVIKLGY